MFSLLLAIIISASLYRSSVANLQGSLGFGSTGAEYHQDYASPSYYNRPMYTPVNSYFGNQGFGGNPQDVYLPGRVNPFSYPYRKTRASPAEFKVTYIPYLNYFLSPQSSIYDTSVKPTSNVNMDRYQLFPYSETYSIYSTCKNSKGEPSSKISLFRETQTVLNSNETSDLSTKRSSLDSEGNETSVKREHDLQMTYLGYVPSLALKGDSHEASKRFSNTINKNMMPFYPLRVDSDSKRSVPSSPLLFSPYRMGDNKLRQSFTNYQQSSFSSIRPTVDYSTNPSIAINPMNSYRPGYLNNYDHSTPQTHFTTTSTHISGGVRPIVSPFMSKPPLRMLRSSLMSTGNPSRYSRTPDQNRYYLFDVQPSQAYDSYGYTKLKSKNHAQMQPNMLTQLGTIQPILQFADGVYHSTLGPVPTQSRTFSNFNFERLFPNQQDNTRIQSSYNSGAQPNLQSYGPSGLSR